MSLSRALVSFTGCEALAKERIGHLFSTLSPAMPISPPRGHSQSGSGVDASSVDAESKSLLAAHEHAKLLDFHSRLSVGGGVELSKFTFRNTVGVSMVVNKVVAKVAQKNGRLPLHLAAIRNSSHSVVSALLSDYPEAATVADSVGRLPLRYAVEHNDSDEVIIALLKTHPAAAEVAEKSGRLPLHFAIANSRSDTVIAALLEAYPASARAADENGYLPLHDAARHSKSSSVIALLLAAYPEAVSAADKASHLPLHEAAGHNESAPVVSALLAAHPDAAKVANKDGRLPLHEAARCNNSAAVCAALLSSFPEAAQANDKNKRSPLHLAVAFNKNEAVVSCLMSAYPEASKLADEQGRLPLHDAAALPSVSDFIVTQLLKARPDAASVSDRNGRLPLFEAARYSKSDAVINALLTVYPEAARSTDDHGHLALHFAAGFNDTVSVIAALLSMHPEAAKAVDRFGRLPLHEAARQNQSRDVIQALMTAYPEAGKVADAQQCLPLHYAVSVNPHSSVAIELLAMMPEASRVVDQNGRLPLELAADRDRNVIAALLCAYPDAFALVSVALQDKFCSQLSLVDDLINIVLLISDHPLYASLYISSVLAVYQKEQRSLNLQLANGADERAAGLEQFACAIARSVASQNLESGSTEFDACLRFAADRNLKFFVGEATCSRRTERLWGLGHNGDRWLIQCLHFCFLNVFFNRLSMYPPAWIRFTMNRLSYFVFVCAIVQLPVISTPGQSISNPKTEAFLLYWLLCIIYSEARELSNFLKDRHFKLIPGVMKYYSDPWSVYDLISFGFAFVSALVRVLLYLDSSGDLDPNVGRQLYAWSIALLWGRLVNILAAVSFIGPLLIMVFRMVFKDLTRFFVLAVLIDVPFVVALYYLEQGKVPENRDFGTFLRSSASFFKISIAQGPSLTDVSGSSWALYASGSVLLGVLLLNLLIAMFSKTFDIIVENSTQEYLLQKAQLTFLWARAPRMPPPLNVPVAFRDAIMRALGKSLFTSDKFANLCTANYEEKEHVTATEFNKKAFQRIFPFNKGTQKFKAWVDKVKDDLEQNGEFNSEAQMDKFKSRMLRGVSKLNRNGETLEGLQDKIVAMQKQLRDESVRLDRKLESAISLNNVQASDRALVAVGGEPPAPESGVSELGEITALQNQMQADRQKLDSQVEVLRQLADQKLQSGNQLEILQEKLFLIQATQKQMLEASQKQDQRLEAVRQVTEERLESMQKKTDQQLQELHALLQQVLGKLNA